MPTPRHALAVRLRFFDIAPVRRHVAAPPRGTSMNVLLTGSTGLIGRRLLKLLLARGHRVVCASRRRPADLPAGASAAVVDFARATSVDWRAPLAGIDAVVNTVGIFRESPAASFEALHHRGPAALFDACVTAGVRRVVHVSALGADSAAATDYHRSKRRGDAHLLGLPLDAVVVQPSLVFSARGASSRTFLTLAALPLLPLPGGGHQQVQPVHLDDAAAALLALVEAPPDRLPGRCIALVGPEPLALRAYLGALREAMGLGAARVVAVPRPLVALAARVGEHLPGALVDRAALSMLERGNTAPVDATRALLGRPPRPARHFIDADDSALVRRSARLDGALPLLRAALAVVWIATAFVSAFVWPVADSLELLARSGVPAGLRLPALYGAAALDLLLGVLTLLPTAWRRWVWAGQALLMLVYMAVITVRLPEFWAHPYGPITKNLPMLAVLWLLWALEPPARRPA